VLAPELRVEFDTWDFLRHHQFSLGHVTLESPDIEIIGDPEDSLVQTVTLRAAPASGRGARPDEAAVVNRYLGWASLMPSGRVEVEGARVHLRRRGDAAARHSFTLSQAVVSRAGKSFSAYGTMLLSQDVGQSLFVSAKLDGLDGGTRISGDLRFIARRVFLDKIPVPQVPRFQDELREHLRAEESIFKTIRESGDVDEETDKKLRAELDRFANTFNVEQEEALVS